MVQTLLDSLPTPNLTVQHVNLGLSRDAADIGRWRVGKIFSVLGACFRTVSARFNYDSDTLYYVPAPGKRGALYRDWLVMLICRPFFKKLVLHWHAAGLNEWLNTHATRFERWITSHLLGEADLSIILSKNLRADAESLAPKRISIVPNGINDPQPNLNQHAVRHDSLQVLFLGLCSAEKGLFITAEAVVAANHLLQAAHLPPKFTLVVAGSFPDAATEKRFQALLLNHPAQIHYVGPVHGHAKSELYLKSKIFCLPSFYPPEGQPLVLLEAMAHDLPIIATRWRAIPDTLPPEAVLIAPEDIQSLTLALLQLSKTVPPAGSFRQHYLAHFTVKKHVEALRQALGEIDHV
jgi:glycosyltransferase involved in cell wall biosynthesis